MKYDDASWHYGGEGFDENNLIEYGGVHIGLFLKWCFRRDWAGPVHLNDPEASQDVNAVIRGNMTGTDFLFKYCDGKLIEEDLNDEGNAFAAKYYNRYLEKIENKYSDEIYHVPEPAIDYIDYERFLNRLHSSSTLSKTALAIMIFLYIAFSVAGIYWGWAISEGSRTLVRILCAIGGEMLGTVLLAIALKMYGLIFRRSKR